MKIKFLAVILLRTICLFFPFLFNAVFEKLARWSDVLLYWVSDALPDPSKYDVPLDTNKHIDNISKDKRFK
jgi:hypothetical protein